MIEKLTGNDIKNAILKNNITVWYPYRCSICNELYGYYFYNGIVTFDSSCGCSSAFGERLSSYDKVAEIYNINTDEQFRKEMLEYFKIQFNVRGDII